MKWKTICSCILLYLAIIPAVTPLKIGILPAISSSRALTMDIITQELIKRGHKTVTIISNEPHYLKRLKPSPLALFETNRTLTAEDIQKLYTFALPLQTLQGLLEIQSGQCDIILSNKTLLQSIQDVDIIIIDNLNLCGVLLPEILRKPSVIISFSGGIKGIHTFFRAYEPATFIPIHGLMMTSRMTFIQRAINVILGKIVEIGMDYMSATRINYLRRKYNISMHLSLHQLRMKFSLYICTLDFSIEYPRPLPPYIKVVGPISAKVASPLSQHFKDIMQSSTTQGIILVSFGSQLELSLRQISALMAAFRELPYTFLYKTKRKLHNVPQNVEVLEWIPQNDILGHNKTVAFITHGGCNSVYEASYHGIPMIAMPFMIEQKGNAVRIVRTGLGVYINVNTFKAVDIINAISKLTKNSRYKSKAVNISKILKSNQRSPIDSTIDWIEYVVKTDGAQHLKVEEDNLWFYEYYALDVMLFLIVLSLFVYYAIRHLIIIICMILIKQSKSQTFKKME